jgi:hypothetical protein
MPSTHHSLSGIPPGLGVFLFPCHLLEYHNLVLLIHSQQADMSHATLLTAKQPWIGFTKKHGGAFHSVTILLMGRLNFLTVSIS